jgi:glycosyltransferase involved in cell wall biosynthesis
VALTVLSVAFPFAPIGVNAVGGAEQILTSIDAALVARGHRSIVVAQRGSSAAGELLALPAFAPTDEERAHAAWRAAIAGVLARERVDVVHLHGLDAPAYAPVTAVPVVCTLHLPPSFYDPSVWTAPLTLCCVSETQRASCPAPVAHVIPNGVDLDRFAPRAEDDGYALALGRICEEKGYHLAADAARRAGVRLAVAGRVFPYAAHERYFAEQLRPALASAGTFVGPVGPRARSRLLAWARCLVVPSLVEETSSLVAMEALASGTPVVAFDRGALPEVIEHARTGFLVRDVDEMAEAIRVVDELDPRACRVAAEERFDARRMHDAYVALYRDLSRRERSASSMDRSDESLDDSSTDAERGEGA